MSASRYRVGGRRRRGGRGGGGGGDSVEADHAGAQGRRDPARQPAGKAHVQEDYNEQRLILKGHLDPSVNNRGYAGVTRGPRRRHGPDGRRHASHRECHVRDVADAH